MAEKEDLNGIGGWLILVAIGLIITPLRVAYLLLADLIPIFSNGTWAALTDPGSESYSPYWAPLLIGEVVANGLLMAVSAYLLYLFFSKKKVFPVWYMGVIAFSLVFIPLDAWLVTKALPDEPMFDPDTTKEFSRSILAAVIWIPYMLVSKRVKATFIEN